MTVEEWLGNDNQLGIDIWTKKYQNNGETFDEWLDRVSNGNYNIRNLIIEKKFLFGGRILANRGVKNIKTTYSNCYVITPPDDSIESIFECASKLARTFSYGGGCGIDLSKLRPKGAATHNAAKESTGPVSFMDIYSQVTGTISQNGRRGALMISIDINHPDLEEFIDCKTDLSKVNFANISVRVNDEFMKAVENNEDYILRWPCNNDRLRSLGIGQLVKDESQLPYNTLVDINKYESSNPTEKLCAGYIKRVKARDLFNKLVKNNWDYAEPGILYWDNISNYNMLNNYPQFSYAGVNPCAEEPLPAGGSCLLGSINLSMFIQHPFTVDARFDYDDFEDTVSYAVQGLNQVLLDGLKLHPLKEQQDSVHDWRQIGLGTFGLADCLIKMGLKYGSDEANKFIDFLYHEMAKIAVLTSLQLAKQDGCYPMCDKEKLVESSFIKALELPKRTIEEIKKYGLYNSQLLTCAPTGTIGTMLETSTGVEPNFAFKYFRKTISLNKEEKFYEVDAKIVKDYKEITGNQDLSECFVESVDINPIDRVVVQSILQRYLDASISSTVNLKKEATVEDVYDIYMNAWKQRIKGITIYRSGCKREGILVTEKKENTLVSTKAPKRPKELPADLYTVKVKGETFIVLVGLLDGKPYEVFTFRPNIDINVNNHKGVIVKKSKMHYMFKSDTITITELELANDNIEEKAATLYSSMLLRHGVDIKYIIKTAKKVNNNITSFSSAMCRVLSKYIPDETLDEKCPECGGTLTRTGGCIQCQSCGWSKCG